MGFFQPNARYNSCYDEGVSMLSIRDVSLNNQRVLIREDLNLPMDGNHIRDDSRLQAALPSIRYALENQARLMLMSHMGRPKAGQWDQRYSLQPVADALSQALKQPVRLIKQLKAVDVAPGECVLYENVRFLPGEKNNDTQLAQAMAKLCDIFVMDAFATAHRNQASTVGVATHATIACAGLLFEQEWQQLSSAIDQPKQPLLAIVGGSKVSDKISVLDHLLQKVDALIVGGGIANTFLAADGISIGKSLYEPDWCERAQTLRQLAHARRIHFPLPTDVAVSTTLGEQAQANIKSIHEIRGDEAILDIGPATAAQYQQLIGNMKTIVWNGPLGVFEWPEFAAGTRALAQSITDSSAQSIAGGGDTVAALSQFGLNDKINYISTAGGAFLQLLEGKELPAITILQQRARAHATD